MPKKLHPTEKRAASRREGLLSLLSGVVAEPAAGIAGLYGLVTGGLNKGADNIEATRNALTYQPRDPSSLQALGRAVAPVADRIESAKRWMGDGVLNKTGSPALATAAHIAPDVLATLLGARGAGIKGPTMTQMAERSAGPSMGSPVSQIGAINAWHGSPHDFDRFSMDHIGTGEGHQAYGHGLYFAGNKEVAQAYAGSVKDSGAVQAANRRMSELAREMDKYAKPGSYGHYTDPRGYELKAEYDALMAGRHETLQKPGNVYDVELAPDDADLLDWDAPLRENPAIVKAVQEVRPGYMTAGLPNESIKTADAYHALAESLGQQGASKFLRERGIPGIRYLDEGSRTPSPLQSLHRDYLAKAGGDVERAADLLIEGQWESKANRAALLQQLQNANPNTHNYVMFDDSLVKIRGKE